MTKEQLINYGLLSFALVLGGRYAAGAVFAWIEEVLGHRRGKGERSLEDMVKARQTLYAARLTLQLSGKEEMVPSGTDPLRLDEDVGPEERRRRELMQRIYHFDGKRLGQESDEAYWLRILDLREKPDAQGLKQAFKTRSKALHPDRFNLDGFDPKTKKRLAARIHENYLLVQKAHQGLKKAG